MEKPRKNLLSLRQAIILVLFEQELRTTHLDLIFSLIRHKGFYVPDKNNDEYYKELFEFYEELFDVEDPVFQNIGMGFVRLRNTIDPLQTFEQLEALLEYDKEFYNPTEKELSFVLKGEDFKETQKLKVSPADIICIESVDKSRKKNFYIRERTSTGNKINRYLFNNNKYNFESLCNYLDPISGYLTIISKNAIVNVAFYGLIRKNILELREKAFKNNVPNKLMIFGKDLSSNFRLIQQAYIRRFLLQKAAIGYKMDVGI